MVYEEAMPIRLDTRAPDFAERFRAFLGTKREASADVETAVRTIIADVAARGDAALIELTRKYDRVDIAAAGFSVSEHESDASKERVFSVVHLAVASAIY